ncbi:hypothetical protein HS7_06650 [Sulfolobales archaeon HS-7]|nr:hypothetical protein HS7_06650 [Sulfolobales archaeon HS-7]
MGGTSKKPISNMEKRMRKLQEESAKKEKKTGQSKNVKENPNKTVQVDEGVIERVKGEISKESYITPYALANRLGISISASKHLLNDLYKRGEIKLVSKTRRVALYSNN